MTHALRSLCYFFYAFLGILDKKKGLWSRRRMFLLTEGPRLFYVDPKDKELKVSSCTGTHFLFTH
jgi:hypothetical protein